MQVMDIIDNRGCTLIPYVPWLVPSAPKNLEREGFAGSGSNPDCSPGAVAGSDGYGPEERAKRYWMVAAGCFEGDGCGLGGLFAGVPA